MGEIYWERAFVGFGANLGDPAKMLRRAEAALRALEEVRALHRSPLYRTRPVGPVPQADFVNAVFSLETSSSAEALLDLLLRLETELGRRRGSSWGPRTIDLDLLLYGELVLDTPRLRLPHPELARRGFVLVPLADLAPDLRPPNHRRTVAELLDDWRCATPRAALDVRHIGEWG